MQTNIYTLPEISFVGGETQSIRFYLRDLDGSSFDATGIQADFSICSYSNKVGEPLLTYTPELIADEHEVNSILSVEIPKSDTAKFAGKYIYQITIIDIYGNSTIPNQGIMNITKNINQNFILGLD